MQDLTTDCSVVASLCAAMQILTEKRQVCRLNTWDFVGRGPNAVTRFFRPLFILLTIRKVCLNYHLQGNTCCACISTVAFGKSLSMIGFPTLIPAAPSSLLIDKTPIFSGQLSLKKPI